MLDAVFIFGVLCAFAGACFGRRASFALLLSAGLALAFNEFRVPFSIPLWMALDLAVIFFILWGKRRRSDYVIVALFPLLWITYFVPGQAGYVASVLISAAQMVLTFPAKHFLRRAQSSVASRSIWSDFDLRVSHGGG